MTIEQKHTKFYNLQELVLIIFTLLKRDYNGNIFIYSGYKGWKR